MLEVLDAAALRLWCATGLESLTSAREEIDDLNVYPVPDGDTGTNLQLTMQAVVEALATAPSDMAATVRAMVLGALMGARGNSGVILSQLLRGLGEVFGPADTVGPEQLKAALATGATSAYAAVAVPREGTVLTVAREAAEGAVGSDLAEVVRSACLAAAASLARTPDLLPQLKAAGVVDAGGRGWCVLLEALEQVVTGAAPPPATRLLVPRDGSALVAAREAGSTEFSYEVQFLLREARDEAVEVLRGRLGALGDSLVVVGGDGLFNVHVHVNDVGAAIEAGVDAGRPFRITVTRFEDGIDEVTGTAPTRAPSGRAVVAVAAGEGISRLFTEAGARVVDGGPTRNPSTAELLAAVRATGAAEVAVLPNDANVEAVAELAAAQARLEGVSVAVLPTKSVLHGLAAASVADAARPFEQDLEAMGSAARLVRLGHVATAERAADTSVGPCRTGDVLGLVAGQVVVVGTHVEAVGQQLLTRLLEGGGELVTLLLGATADPGTGDRLSSYIAGLGLGVEVLVLDGGQPHSPLLMGVE